MSSVCPAIADGAFLPSVLAYVDCQAQNIGAEGYRALSTPGSPLSLMLTGLLTLFVALFGYRMLLGNTPGVRDAVFAVAKIGIVLALATSWGAYRTLVYDVTFHGPAQLFNDVGGPAGLPATGGGLVDRLGQVDDGLVALGRLGAGPVPVAARTRVINGQAVLVNELAGGPPNIFSPFGLGTARLVFLTATIAAFATVRLVAGLLLALGPLFVLFLLFEGTRSLFEGWLRGLLAAAIGALVVTMLLAVELALLEPWLASLIAKREAQLPIGDAGTELLVVMLAFALTLTGGLAAAARVSRIRIAPLWQAGAAQLGGAVGRRGAAAQPAPERHPQAPAEQLSRAAAVAEAVAHVQRRESVAIVGAGGRAAVGAPAGMRDMAIATPAPLGQSYGRRTRGRVSASAGRRDNR
jgi:type IV secretion system protein VirB6